MIRFSKPLSWFKQFYPTKIDQLENFIQEGSMPHLIFSGKNCKDKGLIAQLFAKEITKNGGKYSVVYGNDPITSEERSEASSMSYISKSKLGSSAGESKLVNPFITLRIKPLVEEGTLDNKFRVLIIWDFDKLGKEQESFRRLMEEYADNCRMILIVDDVGNIIDPIVSRCNPFYFPEIPPNSFEKGLADLFDDENMKKSEVLSSLRKASDGSFVKSLLLSSASLNKYKIVNFQTCRNLIRKKTTIDVMIKEVSALRFNLAISEIQRYVQYNYVTWKEFAEEFAQKIITSSFKYREDALIILSEFDEKYEEEDIGYYITYFLIKLKETCGK